jgi:radical SAM superfamily enzyme YgiQ (UPF0313 family)
MRIVVCNRMTEYLGIEIVSAILKRRGHDVRLVFEPDLLQAAFLRRVAPAVLRDTADRAARRVAELAPDVVLFPSEINSFDWCARVGEALPGHGCPALRVHGGFHTTSTPETCIERAGVDVLCIGEGDEAIPELVDALDHGGDPRHIANLWWKDAGGITKNAPRPLLRDLDSLPFPDKSLYYDALPGLEHEYLCVASRGCHWACSFCFYTTLYDIYGHDGFVRARSPQHVIAELEAARRRWDVRTVVFHDDIFPTTLKWLREFAPLYRDRIGLPFSCITHPQLIREDTAELLAEMGCRYVIMGAQTASASSRAANVLNRTETSEEIGDAVKRLRARGIFVLLDHIFGVPGETGEDQEAALRFYADCGPDVVKPFFMTYFPGTDLTKRAKAAADGGARSPGREGAHAAADSARDNAGGDWDHFMFEGQLSGTDFRPYNLAYAAWPLLTERGRRMMIEGGWHRRLAPIGGLPGLGNLILFPRLLTGYVGTRDIRPKMFVNYLHAIARYSVRERLF